MDSSLAHEEKQAHLYERAALLVTAGMFVLAMISHFLRWDWVFDSVFLLGGILLVKQGNGRQAPFAATQEQPPQRLALFLCLYLFMDASLNTVALLKYPGALLLVYAIRSGLYGAALVLRLRQHGLSVNRLPWGKLLQRRASLLTTGALVPLLCMYLPMVRSFVGCQAWSGPTLIYLPGTMYMNAGHTVTIGGTAVLRGCEVAFSRPVLLLLAGIIVTLLLRLEGLIPSTRLLTAWRSAAVLVLLWWILFAKGYQSLGNIWNLAFLAGCMLLLVALFLPQRKVAFFATP